MADVEVTDSGGGGGNVFTRKLGPFPFWVWLVGVTLLVGVAYLWEKHKAGTTAAASGQAAAGQVTGAQNVPDYVFQFSENEPTTINVPPGAPGKPGGPGKPGPPGKTPKPPLPPVRGKKKPPVTPQSYRVKHGDTLSSIAQRYGDTWQELWDYNTGPNSPHTKQAIADMKKRGPNLIYAGEEIYIPPEGPQSEGT